MQLPEPNFDALRKGMPDLFHQGTIAERLRALPAQPTAPEGIERFPVFDRGVWLSLRECDVTASVGAALFGEGVHPYMSPYKLFCLKSGLIQDDNEDSPEKRRGRLLEPLVIDMVREERPDWVVKRGSDYFRDRKARIGATPDAFAHDPERGLGIVQIKTVGKWAFEKGWRNEINDVEPPLWIAVQCHIEMALTGATWGVVAALGLGDGGLDLHLIDVPYLPRLTETFKAKVKDFWRRVEANDPYPPDYGRDAALIAQVYAKDDGGEIDLSDNARVADLVATRKVLKQTEAHAAEIEKQRKEIDAELLHALGNASRGLIAGGVIEAKTIERKAYQVKASSYRAIKVKEVA